VLLYRCVPDENHRWSFAFARITAALAVAAVIVGWGVGQYPWMLVGQLSIREAAGATTTLTALLVVVGLAGVIVLPPLGYLLWFTQSDKPTARQMISA
jgi:cytochrome bd ubiquinol oxidase subunit II